MSAMSESRSPLTMEGKTVEAFGLADYRCEECGRSKALRLFGYPVGCKTCDEIASRHRCTGRPGMTDLDAGESWECADCGSVWTVVMEEDTCRECGRSGMEKTWSPVPGDRMESAPRFQPPPFLRPFLQPYLRRPFAVPADGVFRFRQQDGMSGCYRTPSGVQVHVKPGCRCLP